MQCARTTEYALRGSQERGAASDPDDAPRALARQACRTGLSAWYVCAPRPFEELSLCHADRSLRKHHAAIAKIQLVIIDDFAISPIGLRERNDLPDLLDDRVGSRASILTSKLPVKRWHEYLNDPTLGDVIMGQRIDRSHKIHLQGKASIHKRAGKQTAKD